jgi:hypothetical protein
MENITPYDIALICAAPDYSVHEFGVKSCLKKES